MPTSIGVSAFISTRKIKSQGLRGMASEIFIETRTKKTFVFLCLSLPLWLLSLPGLCQEERLSFLPVRPVFHPLIGDPREEISGLSAQLDQNRFDGSIGAILELLQWLPKDGSRWGWGIEGDSF